MKTFTEILKYLAIAVGVMLLWQFVDRFDVLGKFGFTGTEKPEVRVTDTPEYRQLEHENDSLKMLDVVRAMRDSLYNAMLEKEQGVIKKRDKQSIYEKDRIRSNPVNTNFTELQDIIRQRQQRGR